jgi:hypothetical protein
MSPIRDIQQAPVPGPGGRPGGLGQKLKDVLVSFFVDAYNRLSSAISDTLRHAVDSVLETLEQPLLPVVRPAIERALSTDNVPPEIRAILQEAVSGDHQVGVILLFAAAIFVVPPVMNALFSGPVRLVQYVSNKTFRPNRLDFATWYVATLRDQNFASDLQRELEDQGWTNKQIEAARLAARPVLGVSDILQAKHRHEIGETEALQRLARHGFTPQEARIIYNLGELLPSASDGVRYATREAWRDEVAARWQFDNGRPAELDDLLDRLGFPPWVAQAEWRSHWVLPSISQGLEMYFREEISLPELRQLIVMLDIAPGWINPILNTARPVPGRIDRRWAFEEGRITEEELYTLYRNDGMDDFWARTMVNTIISRYTSEAKGLTRASVVSSYRKHRIKRKEAVDLLGQIHIHEFLANWYLDQADLDNRDEALDRQKDLVGQQFARGLLSDERAREELLAIGIPAEEIEYSLQEWALKRRTSVSLPTRANLEEFFRQTVIGPDEFRTQMTLLGYNDKYIGWYLGSLAFEKAQSAAAEEERAQKERIRTETERRESQYARDKARIDQDIAELNAAIADAQVALVEAQNAKTHDLEQALSPEAVASLELEYQPAFHEVDAAIAQARLGIQRIQEGIQERQARVNDLQRTIAAGRDLVAEDRLRTQRLEAQTSIAQIAKQIAAKRVDIASYEEAAGSAETGEEIQQLQQQILTRQREIAELQEQQADLRVQIEQIDEQLPVQLTAEQRQEMQGEVRALEEEIDSLRVDREGLEGDIREAQEQRLAIDQELEQKISALPGKADQIEIEAKYDTQIAEIRARIQTFRANVQQLRLNKATLNVEWRQVNV